MYLAVVVLLMGALPIASIVVEYAARHGEPDLVSLTGKWFVFWSVGVRLILAGLRQVANPVFTAGTLGALALVHEGWIVPAAIAGGLFYGLAGVKHLMRGDRNATENIATVSDLFILIVLAGYLAAVVTWRG